MKVRLFLISVIFTSSALGQRAWNLQECINYSIANNIGLRQAALNNEVNRNLSNQSKASLLPALNANASHMYNFGKSIDRFTNTFANTQVLSQSFFLSGNIVIWSGLSQYNNIRATEYNYLSGVENLKQQENDLSLNVANAYISVIFSEELLKTSQNQIQISKEQLDRTVKLVKAGSVAKTAELDLKAQLANDELNFVTSQNNLELSFLSLKQLMNLDSITNFSIERPEINVSEALLIYNNPQNIYEESLKNQPGIRSGEYTILSAEKTLAANRGRISPSLNLSATLGTGTSGLAKDIIGVGFTGDVQKIGFTDSGEGVYAPVTELVTTPSPFADQFKNNVNRSIGLTLTIPLFNGLQTHTSVKNAQLNAYNARLGQDLNKQNLYKNIAQAHANARSALNKYKASKTSVEAAKESFRYAQQKFEAGAISTFDFSESKNRLFNAESNLLQSKYDYLFKVKVLDYYMGRPLSF
jgi:outer membrane protein